jgi:ankyrin repeat protein
VASPLFYACEGGHEEFATFLLDNGAEVDAKNHSGVTALFIAAQVGAASVVRLLMDRGADPNLRSTRDDVLPLYVACFEGHLNVVKELLLIHNSKEREEQGTP